MSIEKFSESNGVFYSEKLRNAFENVGGFVGITAVHGLEPFLIVVESARKVNDELEKNGLERKPIILPYVEGHSAYGNRLINVLKDEYDQGTLADIYLSNDIGNILIQTQFDQSGYQPHLESVSFNQKSVQEQLWKYLDGEVKTVSIEGQERIFKDQRLIEINAGANVTAAKKGEASAHFVFPVTFDGLMRLVQEHNDVFDYNQELVKECLAIAEGLRKRYKTILLPDLHTLLEEPELVEELYRGAIFTPPLKEKQKPPSYIHFDFVNNVITDERDNSKHSFNPEKGAVYLNVSGGGMGLDAAVSAAKYFNSLGYAVFMPEWMKGKDLRFAVGSGPSVLFAKDPQGDSVFKLVLMRPGKGITDRAQISEVPMLVIPYFKLDNPEIWGNIKAINRNGLGREFSSRRDIADLLSGMDGNIRVFNKKIYDSQNIPIEVEGPEYTAQKIIEAEISGL